MKTQKMLCSTITASLLTNFRKSTPREAAENLCFIYLEKSKTKNPKPKSEFTEVWGKTDILKSKVFLKNCKSDEQEWKFDILRFDQWNIYVVF